MKLQNPFRTGLVGTLGVLLALGIGAATLQLATILTYVVAAAFLAGFVVLVATSADLINLLHASLLLALGVGALLGRPRTG